MFNPSDDSTISLEHEVPVAGYCEIADLSPEARVEHEFQALARFVRRAAPRGGLAFVLVHNTRQRARLIGQLQTRLSSREQVALEVALESADATMILERIHEHMTPALSLDELLTLDFDHPAPNVICLTGLEKTLALANPWPALTYLNHHRPHFAALKRPLLVWLPPYAYTLLAQHAVDFWGWRSGVFDFLLAPPAAPQTAAHLPVAPLSSPPLYLPALPPARKQARARQLTRWLATPQPNTPTMHHVRGHWLWEQGVWLLEQNELLDAENSFRASLALAETAKNKASQAQNLRALGYLALLRRGQYDPGTSPIEQERAEAVRLLTASLNLSDSANHWRGVLQAMLHLLDVALEMGETSEVNSYLSQGLQLAQALQDRYLTALLLGTQAEQRVQWSEATRFFQQALALARYASQPVEQIVALGQLSRLAYQHGDQAEALHLTRQRCQIARALQHRPLLAEAEAALHNYQAWH